MKFNQITHDCNSNHININIARNTFYDYIISCPNSPQKINISNATNVDFLYIPIKLTKNVSLRQLNEFFSKKL